MAIPSIQTRSNGGLSRFRIDVLPQDLTDALIERALFDWRCRPVDSMARLSRLGRHWWEVGFVMDGCVDADGIYSDWGRRAAAGVTPSFFVDFFLAAR